MSDEICQKHFLLEGKSYYLVGSNSDPYFVYLDPLGAADSFLMKCARRISPGEIVFDVGANIGFSSVVFSHYASRGRIIGFEPSPKALKHAIDCIRLNGIDNVQLVNMAVGKSLGEINFFENPHSASASHIVKSGETLQNSNIVVNLTTLDYFAIEHKIESVGLIKIDVEGYEEDVIDGALELIKRGASVYTEFNSYTLIAHANKNPRSYLDKLVSVFPYVYRFDSGSVARILSNEEKRIFIHDNLTKKGCVDDLFCTWSEW